jgi:hypothetical protein
VIFRRRSRFDELVRRQLDLFAEDEAQLLEELAGAECAYHAADREDAEEAYAAVQLVLDAGAERLADVRNTYASSLEQDAAAEYGDVFVDAARKRFPRLTELL